MLLPQHIIHLYISGFSFYEKGNAIVSNDISVLRQKLLIFLFTLIIFVPFILTNRVVGENTERRTLAVFPNLYNEDGKMNTQYLSQFEEWFNDHFGLRRMAIETNGWIHLDLLGVSTTDEVIIGEDNWMYLSKTVPIVNNSSLYSEYQLNCIRAKLIDIKNYLAEKDITLMVTIIPLKERLYPDYFPSYYYKACDESCYDQIMSILDDLEIQHVDMKRELSNKASESEEYLYLRTDEHWTMTGAFYGYQSIISELSNEYPNMTPYEQNDYQIEKIEVTNGSTINKLGVTLPFKYREYSQHYLPRFELPYSVDNYEYNYDGFYHYIKTTSVDNRKPKLLMLRDSFTGDEDEDERWQMWRFLSLHFSCAEYYWTYDFESVKDIIDETKPNVVIIEAFELYESQLFGI